jgi:hypothetical protein
MTSFNKALQELTPLSPALGIVTGRCHVIEVDQRAAHPLV